MFGKKKVDPKEAAKEAKRSARSGERDIEKELRALDRQEAVLIKDIRATAKKTGNEKATRTLAKQLVQLRAQKEKLLQMKAHISAVGYKGTAVASQAAMAGVMGNVAGAMKQVNAAISPEEMAKVMQEFARQNEVMEMREDLIDDALIDAFDGEDVEAESDQVVSQVLDELGLELGGALPAAPRRPVTAAAEASGEGARAQEDSALDAQTEALLKQLNAL